jgi:hypothetical protein
MIPEIDFMGYLKGESALRIDFLSESNLAIPKVAHAAALGA